MLKMELNLIPLQTQEQIEGVRSLNVSEKNWEEKLGVNDYFNFPSHKLVSPGL